MSNENFFQPKAQKELEEELKKIDENLEKESVKQKTYCEASQVPLFDAVQGIKFDFNSGFRIFFPQTDKKYHLQFFDDDKKLLLYDSDIESGTHISSVKKYYVRYKFIITRADTKEVIFEHIMDLKDKEVAVQFPVETMGDSIGWFSYMERFQKKFKCKLTIVVSQFLKDLMAKQYPDINFINKEQFNNTKYYATYYVGLFFGGNVDYQPLDFRYVGLHRTAGMILGLRTKEELEDIPPRLDLSAKRTIKEKYVVIATQASTQAKYWNNPYGWINVISFLKENGYRVLCIDKEKIYGVGTHFNHIPWGAEDFTGNLPLQERVNLIKNADFFIGLPSGLSWLAWCCKVPIVMISGFSLPNTEFYTPYRIINYSSCIGCWDDTKENFDHKNFLWCPRFQNDENRMFECTKMINPEMVIEVIKTIPEFKPQKKK